MDRQNQDSQNLSEDLNRYPPYSHAFLIDEEIKNTIAKETVKKIRRNRKRRMRRIFQPLALTYITLCFMGNVFAYLINTFGNGWSGDIRCILLAASLLYLGKTAYDRH